MVVKGWKWATCKKPLFWYRKHPESQSANFNTLNTGPQYSYMKDKWMPYLIKYGIEKSTMATKEEIEEAKKKLDPKPEEPKDPVSFKSVKSGNYPQTLVFIATYNSSKYIEECLDSVVGQTYPNQEVVIADNCSTDDTLDIVKSKYPSVKIVSTTLHNPRSNPMTNTVVGNSKCKFYISLGSDDKLCPNFWETLLPLFDKPEIGFVRIGAYQFSATNPSGTYWKPFSWHEAKEIFETNKVFQTSPVRKETWEDVGGVNDEFIWADWDFWMTAVLKGWQWNTCDKPMYWYRRRIEQESWKNETYSHKEIDPLKKKWIPIFKKYGVRGSMLASPKEIDECKEEQDEDGTVSGGKRIEDGQ